MFLIEKLTKLQEMEKIENPRALILERRQTEVRLHVVLGTLGTQTCLLVQSASLNWPVGS